MMMQGLIVASSTNPRAKSARSKMRVITRETERVLDKSLRDGHNRINIFGLSALVALGTGLPLDDVVDVVKAYVGARTDLRTIKGNITGIYKE